MAFLRYWHESISSFMNEIYRKVQNYLIMPQFLSILPLMWMTCRHFTKIWHLSFLNYSHFMQWHLKSIWKTVSCQCVACSLYFDKWSRYWISVRIWWIQGVSEWRYCSNICSSSIQSMASLGFRSLFTTVHTKVKTCTNGFLKTLTTDCMLWDLQMEDT